MNKIHQSNECFPKSDITVTRGDSCRLVFQRIDCDGNPILTKADKVYFTVKKTTRAIHPLFQKTVDDMEFDSEGYYHFGIEPQDTNGIAYGSYFFDVEVILGNVKSTIAFGRFIIGNEVTFARNEV